MRDVGVEGLLKVLLMISHIFLSNCQNQEAQDLKIIRIVVFFIFAHSIIV